MMKVMITAEVSLDLTSQEPGTVCKLGEGRRGVGRSEKGDEIKKSMPLYSGVERQWLMLPSLCNCR